MGLFVFFILMAFYWPPPSASADFKVPVIDEGVTYTVAATNGVSTGPIDINFAV